MIKITCPKKSFWRGGIQHPQGTAEYEDDFFTDEQLEMLQAEPMLTVQITGTEDPQPDPFADDVNLPGDDDVDLSSSSPEQQPSPEPPSEESKQDKLVKAISTLPIDDPSLWTKSGSPQTAALADAAGVDVSAKERDEAWAVWQNRTEE